jgi:hypothetical protein
LLCRHRTEHTYGGPLSALGCELALTPEWPAEPVSLNMTERRLVSQPSVQDIWWDFGETAAWRSFYLRSGEATNLVKEISGL